MAAFAWGVGGDRSLEAVASTADSLNQLLLPLFENQKLRVFGLQDDTWKTVRLSATGHLPLDSIVPPSESGLWSRQIFLMKSEWDELQELWQQQAGLANMMHLQKHFLFRQQRAASKDRETGERLTSSISRPHVVDVIYFALRTACRCNLSCQQLGQFIILAQATSPTCT